MLDALALIAGLILIIKGGTGVIKYSLMLAGKIKISPLIIGIIFVGIGTSLPEIFISIFSGFDGSTGIGLGNIIGSNIAHICLFLGSVLLFIKGVSIGTVKTQQNSLLMLVITLIFSILLVLNKFVLATGLIFIVFSVLLIAWQIKEGEDGAVHEDKHSLVYFSALAVGKSLPRIYLYLTVYLIMLLIGGKLVVEFGTKIAELLNISSFVVGATIVALATSVPELIVTIEGAIAKKGDKLVIGNILGSNIYNILICGGILGLYNVGGTNDLFTIFILLASSWLFILLVLRFKGKVIPRTYGAVFLLLYAVYLLKFAVNFIR